MGYPITALQVSNIKRALNTMANLLDELEELDGFANKFERLFEYIEAI